MIAGMRSYLAAGGVDVTAEEAIGSLVLTSELEHLDGSRFNVDRMIGSLQSALDAALRDGYEGLWATGDMGWEMGPERDYSKLLAYEWQLEIFLRDHPQVSGICQYHVENLPAAAVHVGRSTHSCFFVNETLSVVNPNYIAQQPL